MFRERGGVHTGTPEGIIGVADTQIHMMSNHVRMYINPMFFAHGKKDWRWSLCCRDMYY